MINRVIKVPKVARVTKVARDFSDSKDSSALKSFRGPSGFNGVDIVALLEQMLGWNMKKRTSLRFFFSKI